MPNFTYKEIHKAAADGDINQLEQILAESPELEFALDQETFDNPLIYTAAQNGRLNVVKWLYGRATGEDPKPIMAQRNREGADSLWTSLFRKQFEVFFYILDTGYISRQPTSGPYIGIIHSIIDFLKNAEPDRSEILAKLFAKGFDPNDLAPTRLASGEIILTSPLVHALMTYRPDLDPVIDILLDCQAIDVSLCAKSSNGDDLDHNPLSLALSKQLLDLILKLERKDARLPVQMSNRAIDQILQIIANPEIDLLTMDRDTIVSLLRRCSWCDSEVFSARMRVVDDYSFIKIFSIGEFIRSRGIDIEGTIHWINFAKFLNKPECKSRMLQILKNYRNWCIEHPDDVQNFCELHNIEDCGISRITPEIPVRFETKIFDLKCLERNTTRVFALYSNLTDEQSSGLIASIASHGKLIGKQMVLPIPELYQELRAKASPPVVFAVARDHSFRWGYVLFAAAAVPFAAVFAHELIKYYRDANANIGSAPAPS